MFQKFFVFIGFSLAFINFASACSPEGREGIAPENDQYIPVGKTNGLTMTEGRFNEIIDQISAPYSPIINARGGKLVVDRNWDNGTVNAYATRIGTQWKVAMFGGLARHPKITDDGFSLVMCHELGHHLGGHPYMKMFFWNAWNSNEGQADYFGALKCLRKIWEKDDNQKIVSQMELPKTLVQTCQKPFNTASEVALCERSGMAGLTLANVLADLSKQDAPTFDTPDQRVVKSTFDRHPASQCRLDTYFAASVCEKKVSDEISDANNLNGVCTTKGGQTLGVRPLCWYHPDPKNG